MTKATTKVSKKTTSTAVSTEFSKEQVPQLIEQLNAKLKTLEGDVEEKVSTNVNYDGENIKDVKEVGRLLQMSASLHARDKAYNEEISRYNLQEKPIKQFEQDGKTVAQWKPIIAKAINDLINQVEISKVKSAIERLSAHLDEKTKLQNELANIMNSATAVIN